jgi:hypothetical protein
MKGLGSIAADAFRYIAGKESGAFMNGSMKAAFRTATHSLGSTSAAHEAYKNIKMQLLFAVPMALITPGTPEEKMQGLAMGLGTAFMTMGMNSPWRQAGWSTAMSMLPGMSHFARGIVQGYRGALESRTSLAIPFSHSNLAMDQAFSTLQYSRQRMSDAYSNVGSEAGFFAARYMQR